MTSTPNCTAQLKFRKLLGLCKVTVNCDTDVEREYTNTDETQLRITKWSFAMTTNRHTQTLEACEALRAAELQSSYEAAQAELKIYKNK